VTARDRPPLKPEARAPMRGVMPIARLLGGAAIIVGLAAGPAIASAAPRHAPGETRGELISENAALRSALAARRRELRAAKQLLGGSHRLTLTQRIAAVDAVLGGTGGAAARAGALARAHAATVRESADTAASLAAAKGQLATSRDELATSRDDLATTQDQLSAARAELGTLTTRVALAEDDAAATAAELVDAQAEIAQLENRLAGAAARVGGPDLENGLAAVNALLGAGPGVTLVAGAQAINASVGSFASIAGGLTAAKALIGAPAGPLLESLGDASSLDGSAFGRLHALADSLTPGCWSAPVPPQTLVDGIDRVAAC
jgi:hypothetical protein